MDRIVRGVHQFRRTVFNDQKPFFEMLAAKQQQPQALFITCSDSRVNPNLLTQTEPGDLFIIRNAGNIIPPYGAANSGEAATIEYAVGVLGIKHVIVCGHSHCGAMKALLQPGAVSDLPSVAKWFRHAEATRRVAKERYAHLSGPELDRAVIEENVLVQLNNLTTHPFITARLSRGELNLYGWVYEIETGQIYEYEQAVGVFQPLSQSPNPVRLLGVRSGGPSRPGHRDPAAEAAQAERVAVG